MIIIMKPNASEEAVGKIKNLIESKGLQAHLSKGTEVTIVGVVGDKTKLQGANIEMAEGVDKIVPVSDVMRHFLLMKGRRWGFSELTGQENPRF